MKAKNNRVLMSVLLAAVLAFPGNVSAAEKKKGNTVVLEMKGGETVQGELLAVREDRLVLFDMDALAGRDVPLGDVSRIRIVKPSKFGQGVGTAFLIGAVSGVCLGLASGTTQGLSGGTISAGTKAVAGAFGFGILGIPIGGVVGAVSGIDQWIDVAALPAASHRAVLERLRIYARTAGEFSGKLEVRPSPVVVPETVRSAVPTVSSAEPAAPRKLGRFHLSLTPAYFRSSYVGQAQDLMEEIGFKSAWSSSFLGGGSTYPRVEKSAALLIKDFRIEYSVSRLFALGAAYCPLGHHTVTGRHIILDKESQKYYKTDTNLAASGSGNAFFLTASLFPIPDAFLKKFTFKVTAGIGFANVGIDYNGNMYGSDFYGESPRPSEKNSTSKKSPAGLLAAELIYFSSPNWSLGLSADYKYVSAAAGEFAIDCPYTYYEYGSDPSRESLLVNVPDKTWNFGGWGIGLHVGYHF